ncbi:MAG: hypothetical protein JSS89_06070 [Bacteroidetes bacterium]|nr:hypothetical protein [Bacteroidota bacterium]
MIVVVVLSVCEVSAQSNAVVGVEVGYGRSLYSTSIPAGGGTSTFPDVNGPTYVPVSLASQMRWGDSAGVHWLVSGAFGLQVASMNTSTPVEALPYIDPTDGSIKSSVTDAQLAMTRRSALLRVGIGAEVAGVGVQLLGRMGYVYAAETTHLMTTEHPFGGAEGWPTAEVLDSGRTVIVERIPTDGHHQVLFDVGAAVSYSVLADLATFPMVFTLQPYVHLPLTTVYVNHTTTERLNYGCSLVVGVRL